LPAAPLSTNTWSWTMPTGITDDTVGIIGIMMPAWINSASNVMTLKIGAETIPLATPTSTYGPTGATGFSHWYYIFNATAAMSGAPIVLTMAPPYSSSMRVQGCGVTLTNISAATLAAGTRSAVSGTDGSGAATRLRTGTTLAVTSLAGPVVEVDFISTRQTSPAAVADWAAQTGWTRVSDVYYATSTSPWLAMACAVRLAPVQGATVGGLVWTASDSVGGSTNAYGATSVFALPVSAASGGTPTRHMFIDGAWEIYT
jgi:hypothetical protein